MLDYQNILLSVTAFINAGVVIFVYSGKNKKPTSKYFALFSLFLAFWATTIFLYETFPNIDLVTAALRASYVAALFIVVNFYLFSVTFPSEKAPSQLHHAVVVIPALLFSLATFFPHFLIESVTIGASGNNVELIPAHYYVYACYFIGLVVVGLGHTWVNYFKTSWQDRQLKIQLLAICISVSFAGLLGMYFNLILASPVINDFRYLWTGPLFTFFIGATITYTIFRYGLFNAKAIISELFIFLLWVFTLIRALLSDTLYEQLINGSLFVLTVLLGILLIRSARAEVKAREKTESIAKELEKTNLRLKELVRQKTEFVSIASHQLRSPLTAIKGYASLLLEGSYGMLSPEQKGALKKVFDSSTYMAASIEDFLSVSRIELGTVKYDMKEHNAEDLIKEVVEELLPAAHERKLNLEFIGKCDGNCLITADIGKLRQVILNLVDNSIKYTPKGGIIVTVEKEENKKVARITITDTGVGIPSEVMPTLFKKFSRAKNANEVNVMGTGLGLYVAKQFVEAHKGRVWAESNGQGKGSSFIVEIPLLIK